MCYGMDGPISDVYEGDLIETPNGPVREGQGTLQRADGAVYEGSWQGGLMHGEGSSSTARRIGLMHTGDSSIKGCGTG